MERVGVEFFFNGNQAVEGVSNLASKFFNLQIVQDTATRGYEFFRDVVSKGLEQAAQHTDRLTQSTREISGHMGQIAISSFNIAKGFMMANVYQKGLSALMSSVPAIGQTFAQMGRVISANIVYPLVQHVLPYLVQMMNWVRDNKAMFVQLGQVVTNLFKVFFEAGKTALTLITNLFGRMWETVFGKGTFTFQRFMDLLNLMTLKIAFIVTFISLLLEPVIEGIGDLFELTFNGVILPVLVEFSKMIKYIATLWDDPIKAINDFDTTTQMLAAGGLTLLIAGLYSLSVSMVTALVPALLSVTMAVWGFTVALLANPLTWIVLGVMAVVGALVLLYKNWDSITKAFDDGMVLIKDWWNNLLDDIDQGINNFVDGFWSLYDNIVGFFSGIGDAIKNALIAGFTVAKDMIKNSWVGEALGKLGINIGGVDGDNSPTITPPAPTPLTSPTGSGKFGGAGASTSYADNRQIKFEISGGDPKETANEVIRKLEEKDDIKKQFNKTRMMQGRD